MNIAFFHNLPPGGAKRVAYEQIKYLSKTFDIDLYTLASMDKGFLGFNNLKCKIYPYYFSLDNNLPGFLERAYRDYKNFVTLRRLHRKIANVIDTGSYDLVIVHPDMHTQAPYLLRYLKTPSIYYCHEWLRIVYEPEFQFQEPVIYFKRWYEQYTRSIRKSIDKINAQHSTMIVTNSKFTAEHVKQAYSRTATVCYPGVDTNLFKPGPTKKVYDVLFIGDKHIVEGYDLLNKSLDLFGKKPKIHIISRKNNAYIFTDKALANEYTKAKLVVCLSYNEPFGLIPLEAMSAGVPVIALNEAGYKETVRNNKTGLLVSRSPQDLSRAIQSLLSNDDRRKKMGAAARDYVEKQWGLEQRLDSFVKILYRIFE
jgi:glycosyltransferase involved in cell wall biosynthesis